MERRRFLFQTTVATMEVATGSIGTFAQSALEWPDTGQRIYEDNNGILWFGMADGNLYQFNGETFEKHF